MNAHHIHCSTCACASYEPLSLGLSRGDISAIADNIAGKLGYRQDGKLQPFLEKFGATVRFGEWEQPFIDLSPEKFTITLTRDTGLAHDRFRQAEALGHYVLHVLYPAQRQNRPVSHLIVPRSLTGQAYAEAYWFAASFLMPKAAFQDLWKRWEGDLYAISDAFHVTPHAVHLRAQSLGLVEEMAVA